jgi:hypothetical protein
MRTNRNLCCLVVLLTAGLLLCGRTHAQPADPGWPRVFKKGGQQLTVYQPQVDDWRGYTNLHFRCAVAVKGVRKDETFGVVEAEAVTAVDHGARTVAVVILQREWRFANVPESDLTRLRQAADQLHPAGQAITLSLDRVLACLEPATQQVQPAVELNLDPPRIFGSSTPAVLVIFMGEPRFVPVETNRTDMEFAVNTNWDLLRETASGRYFLLHGEGWLTAPDLLAGPWIPAVELPPSFDALPANANWEEARKHLPGKPAASAPSVFVTTAPAELILTDGPPRYAAIPETTLRRVSNTESVLFLHTGEGTLYLLVAGRWFRGGGLNGPWSAASTDLPADFAKIPDDDPAAFVKASVPGTREAKDAVLLASVPQATTVNVTNATYEVIYTGEPKFVVITNTVVQYAVNTPSQVFLVNGSYYSCSQGMWFSSAAASGPWTFCANVPPAIYTIPPSNPNHNVTYVTVQAATPTTVTYTQTAGYSGEYVAATGVLMFGAGMLIGAAIANDDDYYCYPAPCHYSYGCGAVYHGGGGGYYASAHVSYGPYGGAGRTASYNPYTGTYARSSYAYGPYGAASRGAAYNPYTGARAAGGQVHTAYGSAGRAAGYNPSTGTAARAGYRENAYGSAGAIRTSEGTGMAKWDTQQGQGGVAKTRGGDVYAAKDGTVYKKDANGSWSQSTGSGWESVERSSPQAAATTSPANRQAPAPAPTAATPPRSASASAAPARQPNAQTPSAQPQRPTSATPSPAANSWSQQRQGLESQAQARQSGNRQAQRTSAFRSSPSGMSGRSAGTTSSGGRAASGGRSGGGRR